MLVARQGLERRTGVQAPLLVDRDRLHADNVLKIADVSKKIDDNTILTQKVVDKADEIHTQTNSNLTEVRTELKRANSEILRLAQIVTAMTMNKNEVES